MVEFVCSCVSAQSRSLFGMKYHPLWESDAHSGNRQPIGCLRTRKLALRVSGTAIGSEKLDGVCCVFTPFCSIYRCFSDVQHTFTVETQVKRL